MYDMKRFLLFCIVSAICAVSCCRNDGELEYVISGDKVNLTVRVDGISSTKATGDYDAGEKVIKNLQVFCFDVSAGGALEDYKYVTDGEYAVLSVKAGTKRIYALANAPSLAYITNEGDLLSSVTKFVDNSLNAFQMFSPVGDDAQFEVVGEKTIELSVKRIVAKILIDRLTARFSSPELVPLDFIITGIYLQDVAADNTLKLDAQPSSFISGSDDYGKAVNSMIAETGLRYNLKNNGTKLEMHGFYVYPNNSTTKTKFVIEATMNSMPQKYVLELPELERNKVYEVSEIVFTRLSGLDVDATFKVCVSNWEKITVVGKLEY